MKNRIDDSIESVRLQMQERATNDRARRTLARLNASLDLSPEEYDAYRAVAREALRLKVITPAERASIDAGLGDSPAAFNALPVHVKLALTKMLQEMFQAMKGGRR